MELFFALLGYLILFDRERRQCKVNASNYFYFISVNLENVIIFI